MGTSERNDERRREKITPQGEKKKVRGKGRGTNDTTLEENGSAAKKQTVNETQNKYNAGGKKKEKINTKKTSALYIGGER